MNLPPPSLRTRISLLLTGLCALLLGAAAFSWLMQTRDSIHEEIEAASRVAEQWLRVTGGEIRHQADAEIFLARVKSLGRIRANELEITNAQGEPVYQTPPSPYKAGRSAPGWFSAWVEPAFPARTLQAGPYQLRITPDPSRATLDAWDQLLAFAGWALSLLALFFWLARAALARALAPLQAVMNALERTGEGRFDTRLPVFAEVELARLAQSFNGMADRLEKAVDENVQLEWAREGQARISRQLDEQRREIARELHDEMAQGITAVSTLAAAIAQRSEDRPQICLTAQTIVTVTQELQQGVGAILKRLKPQENAGAPSWERGLNHWQQRHPAIALGWQIDLTLTELPGEASRALWRITQEALTNALRHARCQRLNISLSGSADQGLHLLIDDDGIGIEQHSPNAGSGLGLAGMEERADLLGGKLQLEKSPWGGTRIRVYLPWRVHAARHDQPAHPTPLQEE